MRNKSSILFFSLIVTSFSFFCTRPCNDDNRIQACAALYEHLAPRELLKRAIFNEGHAEHPTMYAWKTGLSINDIVAYQHVSKEWNAICKEYVNGPRQAIVEKYKNDFAIIPSTLLFNKYGDWCCVTKNANKWLTGNVHQNIPRHINSLRPTKQLHIRSLDTRYYGPDNAKAFDDMFLITSRDKKYLLLPSQQQLYVFLTAPDKHAHVCELQKTTSSLLQRVFDLSIDNKFWYPSFTAPGVFATNRSHESSLLSIALNNSFFTQYMGNLATINATHDLLKKSPCACTTGFMDKACYALYQQGCNLAEEESIAGEYTKISELFIHYHVLHKIKSCGNATPDADIGFYANPAGDIIAKTSKAKLLLHDNQTPLLKNYSTQELLENATLHASNWQRNGLVLYGVTYNQESILLPQYFCKADGTLIPLGPNRVISKSPEETIVDVCHVYRKKEDSKKLKLFHVLSLYNNTDKTSRIVSLDTNNVSHPIPYACERFETLKNGFTFLSSKYNKEVPWNCSITVPPNVSASFMQYIKRFTRNIYESSEAVSFFSHHTPFKEWALLGNVPFEVQDNKITFPKRFYTNSFGYALHHEELLLKSDEKIEDINSIFINNADCFFILLALNNIKTKKRSLYLRNQIYGETSLVTHDCSTHSELTNGIDAIVHTQFNGYHVSRHQDYCINAPDDVIKNFMKALRAKKYIYNKTEQPVSFSEERPICISNIDKISPLTCEILKNQNCFVKPIGLFERVTFGFKARFGSRPYTNLTSSYVTIGGGGTLCVASFLFAAFLKEFRKSFPSLAQTSYLTPATYLLLGLIPILQVCASEDHQKFVWPSRFIGWALYACAGKFLYTSLLPQVGLTLLPPLALAAHIFEVNKKNPLLKMTFGEFYDSLPVHLRRMYKKAQSYLSGPI